MSDGTSSPARVTELSTTAALSTKIHSGKPDA